jgi:hypothetical protein
MRRLNNIKKIFHEFAIVITVSKEPDLKLFIQQILKLINLRFLIILYFDKSYNLETFNIAKQLEKKYLNIITIKDRRVKNLADAYYRCYKFGCKFNVNWLISMNAGWRHSPKDLLHFIKFVKKKYVCIWGYRNKYSNYSSYYRKIISSLGNFLSAFLLNLPMKDLTSGFYMINKEILKKELNKINGFLSKNHFIDTELKYYLKGHSFKQIRIKYKSPNKRIPILNIWDSTKILMILFFKHLTKILLNKFNASRNFFKKI